MSGQGMLRDAIRDAFEHTSQGFQQITTLGTSQSLTVPMNAQWARIEAEAQTVRWRDDGTDPTPTVGMTLVAGAGMDYHGNLAEIEFIEVAAGAKLNVTYYS